QHALESNLDELERRAIVARSPDCVVVKPGFLRGVPRFLLTEVLRRIWRHAGWPEQGMTEERWSRLAALVRRESIKKVAIGAGVTAVTDNLLLVLRRSQSGD